MSETIKFQNMELIAFSDRIERSGGAHDWSFVDRQDIRWNPEYPKRSNQAISVLVSVAGALVPRRRKLTSAAKASTSPVDTLKPLSFPLPAFILSNN